MAQRASGRVTWAQLERLGIAKRTISLWIGQGYLHPRLPGVYAVGHCAPDPVAALAEALLYAGPGAALSHATAAWWLGMIDDQPRLIHVSTPRRCRSQPGVVVHARRCFERVWYRRLPVTTLPQMLLDLASAAPLRTLRRALANADYRDWLDLEAIEMILGSGRPGTRRLRDALRRHQPDLARAKSEMEILFFERCENHGIPLPEVNEWVDHWEVDVLWRQQRVAVELDGVGNHKSPAQVRRDRRKDLYLRSVGYTPLRYTEDQLLYDWSAVHADLRQAGAPIPPEPSA